MKLRNKLVFAALMTAFLIPQTSLAATNISSSFDETGMTSNTPRLTMEMSKDLVRSDNVADPEINKYKYNDKAAVLSGTSLKMGTSAWNTFMKRAKEDVNITSTSSFMENDKCFYAVFDLNSSANNMPKVKFTNLACFDNETKKWGLYDLTVRMAAKSGLSASNKKWRRNAGYKYLIITQKTGALPYLALFGNVQYVDLQYELTNSPNGVGNDNISKNGPKFFMMIQDIDAGQGIAFKKSEMQNQIKYIGRDPKTKLVASPIKYPSNVKTGIKGYKAESFDSATWQYYIQRDWGVWHDSTHNCRDTSPSGPASVYYGRYCLGAGVDLTRSRSFYIKFQQNNKHYWDSNGSKDKWQYTPVWTALPMQTSITMFRLTPTEPYLKVKDKTATSYVYAQTEDAAYQMPYNNIGGGFFDEINYAEYHYVAGGYKNSKTKFVSKTGLSMSIPDNIFNVSSGQYVSAGENTYEYNYIGRNPYGKVNPAFANVSFKSPKELIASANKNGEDINQILTPQDWKKAIEYSNSDMSITVQASGKVIIKNNAGFTWKEGFAGGTVPNNGSSKTNDAYVTTYIPWKAAEVAPQSERVPKDFNNYSISGNVTSRSDIEKVTFSQENDDTEYEGTYVQAKALAGDGDYVSYEYKTNEMPVEIDGEKKLGERKIYMNVYFKDGYSTRVQVDNTVEIFNRNNFSVNKKASIYTMEDPLTPGDSFDVTGKTNMTLINNRTGQVDDGYKNLVVTSIEFYTENIPRNKQNKAPYEPFEIKSDIPGSSKDNTKPANDPIKKSINDESITYSGRTTLKVDDNAVSGWYLVHMLVTYEDYNGIKISSDDVCGWIHVIDRSAIGAAGDGMQSGIRFIDKNSYETLSDNSKWKKDALKEKMVNTFSVKTNNVLQELLEKFKN